MMQVILFIITMTCTINIAFNLFVLELNESFSFEMADASINMLVMLSLTFAYFYFSERVTVDLLRIDESFYNSAWYRLLTAKQQRRLVLPIQRAQRAFRLTCWGLIDCSLPVFLQIIKTAASYFIMIRRLN